LEFCDPFYISVEAKIFKLGMDHDDDDDDHEGDGDDNDSGAGSVKT